MVRLKFVKTHEDARLPERNHKDPLTGDVGYDLFAVESVEIPPQQAAIVPVGLVLGDITPGYWFRIEARSGLGFKKGLQPHPGVIDNPYRGSLGVKLYNLSNDTQKIEKGQACAQFIVYKMIQSEVEWIDEVVPSKRGSKGFGSSDNQ